jgi:hypothetical protein
MILTILGIMMMLIGSAVSIIFWIPALFNRKKIRDVMGSRYPLVYVVYIANGPLLILFGLLLFIWPKVQ